MFSWCLWQGVHGCKIPALFQPFVLPGYVQRMCIICVKFLHIYNYITHIIYIYIEREREREVYMHTRYANTETNLITAGGPGLCP